MSSGPNVVLNAKFVIAMRKKKFNIPNIAECNKL